MRLCHLCNPLLLLSLQVFHDVVAGSIQDVLAHNDSLDVSPISFLTDWDLLGPFRIGTREAVWGADPVELYEGIHSASHNKGELYHSPLTRNATVQWTRNTFRTLTSTTRSSVELILEYPDVDWKFAQKIYGWSAFQFQGWLKGSILNSDTTTRRVLLHPENILELWVNDIHVFGGDYYGFGRAPILLELEPGFNRVSVRLIRDVRSMGGAFPPVIQASLGVEVVSVSAPVRVVGDSIMLPDVVNGRFCSRYGSVVVRNQADHWIQIRRIIAYSDLEHCTVLDQETTFAPGQSRPVKMDLVNMRRLGERLKFVFEYTAQNAQLCEVESDAALKHVNISSLQKITFLHPSGAVSYATLRPPPGTASLTHNQSLPILLNLHGAGVEVDDPFAREMFDNATDLPAWILSPTGMTSWSADDWHTWGFADTQAAIMAIPQWIQDVAWEGPGVYSEKVLVAGHSNGGQGTWYFATHQPDRVLGAAAASGYSSIENYVPFVLWNEGDSLQTGILQASRNSFRHELLAENLAGLPIFQQHGSADDNVPTYHSRLMNTLLAQAGHSVNYSEIPNAGHWFEGTMTTPSMVNFYLTHLDISNLASVNLSEFTFVVPNSGDLGSKNGLFIDQLVTPDRLGKVKVTVEPRDSVLRWRLRTQNIRRLHLDPTLIPAHAPDEILLDEMPHVFEIRNRSTWDTFLKEDSSLWLREVSLDWRNLDQRYGRQRGALDSVLRSNGPFEIVHCSDDTLPAALQTSRNFLQYFGADSNLVSRSMYEEALSKYGNVITIGYTSSLPPSLLPSFPLRLSDKELLLTTKNGEIISIPFTPGMGGIWLRPLPDERLELVVWGYDEVGLRQATRLLPTLTGAGQPDFVILGDETRWKGHAGAVAMGFFDYNWRISSASYLP